MYDKQIFSDNLQHYMKLHNEAQSDIAKLLGISKSNVSAYMRGEQIPRMNKIKALCDHYGIKVSDLLEVNNPATDGDGMEGASEKQLELIARIRRLSPEKQALYLALLEAVEGTQPDQ